MNLEQTQVIQACAQGALTGELTFPEIVGRLMEIGVERYHADYSRQEITYYFAAGCRALGSPLRKRGTEVKYQMSQIPDTLIFH